MSLFTLKSEPLDLVISQGFGIGEVVCVERKRGKFPDFFRHTQVQHEIRIKGIFHEISGLPAFDHVLEYRVVCFCFRERVNSTVLIHVCYRINILVIGFVFSTFPSIMLPSSSFM